MKYTIHTTITYSTEFDSDELRKLGITSKKKLLDYAKQNYDENNITAFDARIHNAYEDTEARPVRRSPGSY